MAIQQHLPFEVWELWKVNRSAGIWWRRGCKVAGKERKECRNLLTCQEPTLKTEIVAIAALTVNYLFSTSCGGTYYVVVLYDHQLLC